MVSITHHNLMNIAMSTSHNHLMCSTMMHIPHYNLLTSSMHFSHNYMLSSSHHSTSAHDYLMSSTHNYLSMSSPILSSAQDDLLCSNCMTRIRLPLQYSLTLATKLLHFPSLSFPNNDLFIVGHHPFIDNFFEFAEAEVATVTTVKKLEEHDD